MDATDGINESAQSNFSAGEWNALANIQLVNKTIVTKSAEKDYSLVLWDESNYLYETLRQHNYKNIFEKLVKKVIKYLIFYEIII